jgi:hypothetical protein
MLDKGFFRQYIEENSVPFSLLDIYMKRLQPLTVLRPSLFWDVT